MNEIIGEGLVSMGWLTLY